MEIDYTIIEHFSKHLYGSPYKAVEELVSNSFDAMARQTFVYVPGRHVADSVVVWDDGEAMDLPALQALWWIARSPKQVTAERMASTARGGVYGDTRPRPMIGKFGIGKLASYKVGHQMAHLSKLGGRFLLVAVDYRMVLDRAIGEKYSTPIRELTEDEAREWAEAHFQEPGAAFEALWERDSWTLAVIEELKDIELTKGRLSWIVGNCLPMRPDFRVYVNDEEVAPKIAGQVVTEWALETPQIRSALDSDWRAAVGAGSVHGELSAGASVDGVWEITFPELGAVSASMRIFRESVLAREQEEGRSYGFFIMVRERLVNPNDTSLPARDPSYGTFYRSQFVIRANGLDQDLLADRERLAGDTPRTKELRVLQEALYHAARVEVDRGDAVAAMDLTSERFLPTGSRELFRDPMTALLTRERGGALPATFDLASPRVERATLAADGPLADLEPEGRGFRVNLAHPFFRAVKGRLGGGQKAREALRALDLVAVGERLLEGYLYDIGLPEEQVQRVVRWRDQLFRVMAARYEAGAGGIVEEVRDTSATGHADFEKALAKLFRNMGFEATRVGTSGRHDVLVVAPTGETATRFTLEGKGSQYAIGNDEADVDAAAAHRTAVGAGHAVIVAREFVGFQKGENPQILKQCREVRDVSIATVDLVVELYEAVLRYFYPLELILEVLSPVESPADKHARLATLVNPTDRFDFARFLEVVWDRQNQTAAFGDVVPYRAIWQDHFREVEPSFDAFKIRVTALEAMGRGLILHRPESSEITLRQAPQIIVEAINEALKLAEVE